MLAKLSNALVVAAAVAALSTPALASSKESGGSTLNSGDTVNYASHTITTTAGNVIHYTVNGWGSGTNWLKVTVQQKDGTGTYKDVAGIYWLQMSGTGAKKSMDFDFTVLDFRPGASEEVRLKFNKDLWTSKIVYTWSGEY